MGLGGPPCWDFCWRCGSPAGAPFIKVGRVGRVWRGFGKLVVYVFAYQVAFSDWTARLVIFLVRAGMADVKIPVRYPSGHVAVDGPAV